MKRSRLAASVATVVMAALLAPGGCKPQHDPCQTRQKGGGDRHAPASHCPTT